MIRFPAKGKPKEEVVAALSEAKQDDILWEQGKAFGLVYDPGEEILDLLKTAALMFFSENGLNPTAFPSLRHFETEVVGMTADLLGGDEGVVGNMTSGGTESCLMAVKTARDWARANRPEVHAPEMILPRSAHPAFEKAGQYFGVRPVHTALREDYRADVEAVKAAITPDTILIVASAPTFPQGVVDPIPEMAELALEQGILFHTDACVGGFMLPFVRQLGYPVHDFDFQVPGVTSISADLHKFGYAAKGASTILYRNKAIRRHQLFAYTDWPGGIYASATMAGTRPAGPIAAAWAIMKHLGREGYLHITKEVMETTVKMQEGIELISGVHVLSDPEMSVFALGSEVGNIYEIGDEMSVRGWHLDRQQFPPSLHFTVNYAHVGNEEAFLEDLLTSVAKARKPSLRKTTHRVMLTVAQAATRFLPEELVSTMTSRATSLLGVKGASLPERSAAMYGMMGSLPNRGDLKELVLDLVEQFTAPDVER